MKIFLFLVIFTVAQAQSSSRKVCKSGDNRGCEKSDGEGACCAVLTVQNVVSTGSTEKYAQQFLRCYNFDTVLKAFDNGGVLVDTVAAGGNGNTYKIECTETILYNESYKKYSMLSMILTVALSQFLL